MPILKDGVNLGLFHKRKGFYKNISNEHMKLLEKIKPKQRKNFKSDKKLIPYPLLQLFWRLGFLPIMEYPTQGMRIPAFLQLLSHGEYRDKRHKYKGIWLRDKVEEEAYPKIIKTKEMYLIVNGDGHKRTPASYFRGIPGTIIK